MGPRFPEVANIAVCFNPVNMATAANTGDWFNMAGYGRLGILLFKGAGASSEDPTITLLQGTTSAGGTTKALNVTEYWIKQDTVLTATEQWTHTTQSAANTVTNGTLAECSAIIWIEIDNEALDGNNGYAFVNASVADVGTTSQIGGILYVGLDPTYSGATLPLSQS
jgi:hypothetical protein